MNGGRLVSMVIICSRRGSVIMNVYSFLTNGDRLV